MMRISVKWMLPVLALCSLISLFGCSEKQTAKSVDIALIISEKGGFEGNYFNRGAWDGMKRYADEAKLICEYYEPENRNEDEYDRLVETAIQDGASILVFPGYLLEPTVFKHQDNYPDVRFVLLDGVPNNGREDEGREEKVGENTYSVLYAEEQAGFLAGYAAVMDGNRNLGFFGGMSVPAVMRFGHGFAQGAEYAAQELSLPPEAVALRYVYCGSFSPSPEYQVRADQWYHQGTEVIFACGGAMGTSVITAATNSEKWVIGVDTDQSGESDMVLTSALKMVGNSVYDAVRAHYAGAFPGGQSDSLGADSDGVGLTLETARFRQFGQEQYDAVFQKLASGEISVIKDAGDTSELPLSCVAVLQENMRD